MYSGPVAPRRGLEPFAESERDVLFGRDADIQELARMVTGKGFRAGLLYGEPGVGKTSLLRAGLIPYLREQRSQDPEGVIALVCPDITRPVEAFQQELMAATGLTPSDGEAPVAFLARVVSSLHGIRHFVFVLDEVELVLRSDYDDTVQSLSDLFARVVTRSGGRARFLFSCASEHVHRFSLLEQRTGSLFPPACRYQLGRLERTVAIEVLDRILGSSMDTSQLRQAQGAQLAQLTHRTDLATAMVGALGQGGPVLPADLQVSALAVTVLGVTTPEDYLKLGGPVGLERAWLRAGAAATGDERAALRLLAEVSAGMGPYWPEWAAARASVDPGFARHAFAVLAQRGIVRHVATGPAGEQVYQLASPILLARVHEQAAPARAATRRAFELLGSKVQSGKRLSLRELRALQVEGIAPATDDERAVIQRTKRWYARAAAVAVAAPVMFLLVMWLVMSGRYYFDLASPAAGGGERIVVRAGRPSLTWLDWLPGSPELGAIVADTGLTRSMVPPKAWEQARAHALTGDLDDYGAAAMELLTPTNANLVEYATTGSSEALVALRRAANEPQDVAALLAALQPIARGGKDEAELVELALKDSSPAVQRAALAVAATTARRREGVYRDILAKALTAPDAELRRLAFAEAAALGEQAARGLYQAALTENPQPRPRRELLAALAAGDTSGAPDAASAASILVNDDLPATTRDKARAQLKRAFSVEPALAAVAAATLAADPEAPEEERILALQLMRDSAPPDSYEHIVEHVKAAQDARSEPVRAAALPVYARIAPRAAAGELAMLLDSRSQASVDLRVAMALAWGEVAKSKEKAAGVALEALLDDDSPAVRAAAAEAYGNVGRSAQDLLVKMVKNARFDVATGAARGLANSAAVGASVSDVTSGLRKLWKRKGRSRRVATEVYAVLARTHASTAYSYLAAASRSTDDPALHVIGVTGLCNGTVAGHRRSRRMLERATRDSLVEVRRAVIECIADNPSDPRTAARVALDLADDLDSQVRADAARVLAGLAAGDDSSERVVEALVRLAKDSERDVRLIAIRSLSKLGESAPKEAASEAIMHAFARADEREKLVLLQAAQELGATELLQQAITDSAAQVRIAAVDVAIATGTQVAATLSAGLTDSDPEVRRAALDRLVANRGAIEQSAVNNSLRLAIGDSDPGIAQLALVTLGRLGSSDDVAERLGRALHERSEQARAQAAAACIGLVERDVQKALELLVPLVDDSSHDVRVAMLPALASAWASTRSPEQLARMLRSAESHAMRRIAATAALVVLSRTQAGQEAAVAALEAIARTGPSLARVYAKLGIGLIVEDSGGIEFLQLLVP